MKELKLPELIKEVLAKLEGLKYSKGTLNGHRCVYKYLLEYAATIPTDEYTEELGSIPKRATITVPMMSDFVS